MFLEQLSTVKCWYLTLGSKELFLNRAGFVMNPVNSGFSESRESVKSVKHELG